MNAFKIGILGNRKDDYPPHIKMDTVFKEFEDCFDFTVEWIPTETLAGEVGNELKPYQGIVAGSGPYESKEGVINGIRYARKNNIPFLGTCSGFGYAVLEFGQNLFGLEAVHHPNEGIETTPVESFLQPLNFCSSEMYPIAFTPVRGTLTDRLYQDVEVVEELTHCVYGVNTQMIEVFGKAGLVVGAYDMESEPKIMEYKKNAFFMITLFLPQFKSFTQKPHPLLWGFLNNASQNQEITKA